MSKNDNLGEKINTPTKKCKYCRKEIAIDAKVCTNCWRKQNSIGKYIVIGILLLIFVSVIVTSLDDTEIEKDNNNSSNSNSEVKKAEIGDKITINKVDYTVNSKKLQKSVSSAGGYLKYTADGTYLLIQITITNNSESAININSTDFSLTDENGATYASSTLISADIKMFAYETINPNATKTGYIAYDIANTDLHYTLTINGDGWFDYAGIEVPIQSSRVSFQ